MTPKNAVKVAIVDGNRLFRESIVEFLSMNGFQVVLQVEDTSKMTQGLTDDTISLDVCLIQINEYDNKIEKFIKHLKVYWPLIKVVIYSLEFQLGVQEVSNFGADAVLTESTSLAQLKKTLGLTITKNVVPHLFD